VCRAAWLLGVTVRDHRELEAGDTFPSSDVYERIREAFGWPELLELKGLSTVRPRVRRLEDRL
jgi:hypothetical protein